MIFHGVSTSEKIANEKYELKKKQFNLTKIIQ